MMYCVTWKWKQQDEEHHEMHTSMQSATDHVFVLTHFTNSWTDYDFEFGPYIAECGK